MDCHWASGVTDPSRWRGRSLRPQRSRPRRSPATRPSTTQSGGGRTSTGAQKPSCYSCRTLTPGSGAAANTALDGPVGEQRNVAPRAWLRSRLPGAARGRHAVPVLHVAPRARLSSRSRRRLAVADIESQFCMSHLGPGSGARTAAGARRSSGSGPPPGHNASTRPGHQRPSTRRAGRTGNPTSRPAAAYASTASGHGHTMAAGDTASDPFSRSALNEARRDPSRSTGTPRS